MSFRISKIACPGISWAALLLAWSCYLQAPQLKEIAMSSASNQTQALPVPSLRSTAPQSANRKPTLAVFQDHLVNLAIKLPRRTALSIAMITINALLPLRLLGAINKRIPFIHSLFISYPASDRFSRHYCFDFLIRKLKWNTMVVGLFIQGGKLGLHITTSTTEREFVKAKNADLLEKLQDGVLTTQECLGIKDVHYAGVLPHYMKNSHGTKGPAKEANQAIARLVLDAHDDVLSSENLKATPVIVLGSMGAIGRELVDKLQGRGVETYCVDSRQETDTWPHHLKGQSVLLIDVARKGARAQYLDRFWSKMVLLNETFPEPHGKDLSNLQAVGMPVYHVVGVQGKALPKFPEGYAGGIPCCAMHEADTARVMVKKMG